MPTPRKAADVPDNLMLLVGQLLEATKAASDGLKAMSTEVQSNARAIIAAATTLKTVESQIGQLEQLVRASASGGLVGSVAEIRIIVTNVQGDVAKLTEAVEALQTSTASVGSTVTSARSAALVVANIVAWAATTAIAVYAAVNGK